MATTTFPAMNAETVMAEVNAANIPADLKNTFCKDWQTAKSVLQTISQVWKNPLAKLIIGAVISAGDAIQGAVCK